MSLFPQTFIDDLKSQTDIVAVIGEVVPLKKTGGTFKGLCPFHQEKTPSFNVNSDERFFKCFGCQTGGDVVKFIQLTQKITFPEAVRYLAQRIGMPIPETQGGGPEDRALSAEREALLKLHEDAAAFYREQLAGVAGTRARRELASRALSAETIKTFGYGYAPAAGRETLQGFFASHKVPLPLQIKSGLVIQRDDGRLADRFRNRLMIPIARDNGSVVAFGGRALEEGQIPKYLNSPETPIYTKGRTLYGLDVTKAAIRKHNYCVLVEGYFDLAQVWQAGVHPVAASCGTALTGAQVDTLKRFAPKVVLSFDPDAAGQGAAAKSSELLVSKGFQVNVALLPEGTDPDTFIRREGGAAYVERLKQSPRYLEFLLDRAAAKVDLTRDAGRKAFLNEMLAVAAIIPDAADRDQFADRLAHKARITEGVIRDEIRKAAAQRKTEAPVLAVTRNIRLLPAEQGLLWLLVHRPVEALGALSQLDPEDLAGLVSGSVFSVAASVSGVPADVLPSLLAERLSEEERALLSRAAEAASHTAPAPECVKALKTIRYRREIGALQERIDELQAPGHTAGDTRLSDLWAQKTALIRKLEDFKS